MLPAAGRDPVAPVSFPLVEDAAVEPLSLFLSSELIGICAAPFPLLAQGFIELSSVGFSALLSPAGGPIAVLVVFAFLYSELKTDTDTGAGTGRQPITLQALL